jgi:metal-dependent amidase/aminoacylase/carboxypeptidase family protein
LFREQDVVRVHPIISHGGDAVNVVPASATIETYVRASNLEALRLVNDRVDRAAMGSAISLGAGLTVTNLAGYLPLRTSPALNELLDDSAGAVVGVENIGQEGHMGGTTDVGDISHLIPTANLWFGGAEGSFHAADFVLSDHRAPIAAAAQTILGALVQLHDSSTGAMDKVQGEFVPALDKSEYLDLLRSLTYDRVLTTVDPETVD